VTLRLATRGSRLALAQTEIVVRALAAAGHEGAEPLVVQTRGDRNQTTPVAEMEGQGWFTAEVERTLLDGRAELAVHSAKDLPSQLSSGLEVAAHLGRGDPRDALVSRDRQRLGDLPSGARVGTSSARRINLLRLLRPDVEFVPMRGNVDTRLAKLDGGEVDALVLAAAGLDRLDSGHRITERLDPTRCVPAPCQGIIVVEAVRGAAAAEIAADVDVGVSRAAATCERTVLMALGGGCLLPMGAWARLVGDALLCIAAIADQRGHRHVEMSGDPDDPAGLGQRVAEQLR